MHNRLHTVQATIRPEYFFWTAMLGLFFLFLFPDGAVSERTRLEAAAIVAKDEVKETPYQKLELEARAVYVYDVKRGRVLFEKNATEVLPLASITKVMTALTALSLVPETTDITISSEALKAEGDSGLKGGERWVLRDLLAFMLVKSSNDGAVAVSSTLGGFLATSTESFDAHRERFIAEMNILAEKLGLHHTSFQSESGLDIDTEHAGAYSTAKETSEMFAYAIKKFPDLFQQTKWSELLVSDEQGAKRKTKNTNTEIERLPLLIASKTGYTDLAGGNLVVAFDAGFDHPIVVTVLGSTQTGRFDDVEKLIWATLESLQQN